MYWGTCLSYHTKLQLIEHDKHRQGVDTVRLER